MKKVLLSVIAVMAMLSSFATTYYYKGSGSLTTASNWHTTRIGTGGSNASNFTTSGDIFVIQSGQTGSVSGSWTLGTNVTLQIEGILNVGAALTIGATGTLEIMSSGQTSASVPSATPGVVNNNSGGITINATGNFKINANATYNHNSADAFASTILAGVENFASTSNFVVGGSASPGTGPSTVSTTGSFGNFTFSPSSATTMQCNDVFPNVAGNLTISGTPEFRLAGNVAANGGITISGNLIISSGIFSFGNGTAAPNITLLGNFNMSGGTFQTACATNPSTNTFTFNKSGTQTFTKTGGTITAASSSGRHISMVVAGTSTLDMGTNILNCAGSTNLDFTVNSGGTLRMGDPGGIVLQGTSATTGNIQTSSTSIRNFSTGGNYEYSGVAAQVTGNGLPGALTGNLVISNTAAPVTFSQATTTTGNVTVNTGATLTTGAFAHTMNTAGAVAINGTFQIDQGGFAGGTATWTYNPAATLKFSNTSGSYGVNSGHSYWPASNGPQNVNVAGAGGITMSVARTVGGLFQYAAGVTTANNLTLNGTFQVNAGGFVSGSPTYGPNSLLKYNTGGNYGFNGEWLPNASSGAGYPANVQISNNTTLDYPNGFSSASKYIAKNLTIDAGSSLYMDFGGFGVNNPLVVGGDVNMAGNLSLGNQPGGDIRVGGNWTHTTGAFNANSRAAFFTGTANQTITKSGGETFPYLRVNKASGDVVLANDVSITFDITFTQGNVVTGSNKLIAASNAGLTHTSGHVVGNYEKNLNIGLNNVTFPVGDATTYRPVQLDINATAGAGSVIGTTSLTAGDHPNIGTSTLDAAKSVNRYWTLTNNGTSFSSYDATFEFVAGDLDGGATAANLKVGKYNSPTWTYPTTVALDATHTRVTGLTSFSDFAIAEFAPLCVGPAVTGEPVASQNVCHNGIPTDLTVTATGDPTLTYQWYSNNSNSNSGGTIIVPATSATYTPPTGTVGTKWYYVVVTNGCGADTSIASQVIVTAATVHNTTSGFNFCSIQSAIDAGTTTTGNTIVVDAGTYDEDVNISKSISLEGAGAATTTIRGVIGGPSTTVFITANSVGLTGFTITRAGNNTTDWNNPGLNTAGVAIQGSVTGAYIYDNIISGNRTGVDVNNSGGHTITGNTIDNNHTGMIFRNTTDNMNVTENFITNNRTVGIVFLDGTGGTNVPVQSAANSNFHDNNISANWYAQIVDRQSGGALPVPGTNKKNFSGNWYGTPNMVVTTANSAEPGYAALIPVIYGGSATAPGGQPDIAGPASANFDYTPYLNVGTDIGGGFGFQGDFSNIWVTTLGAQTGSAGRVQEGATEATVGGNARVLAGTYVENATIPHSVNILGPNVGIDPNTGSRVTEAIVLPAVTETSIQSSTSGTIFRLGDGAGHANINIDGFTIDGHNAALTGGRTLNGVEVHTGAGIINSTGSFDSNPNAYDVTMTVQNNIIKNLERYGVLVDNIPARTANAGNMVSHNKIDNLPSGNNFGGDRGRGIAFEENAYGTAAFNVITRVNVGWQDDNYDQASPGAGTVVDHNTITTYHRGIFHNLQYLNATNATITDNTISVETTGDFSASSSNFGLQLASIQSAVGATVSGNNVSGNVYGYLLWNLPTSANIVVKKGTIANTTIGVRFTDDDPQFGGGNASHVILDSLTINNSTMGIQVEDDNGTIPMNAEIMHTTISNSGGTGIQALGGGANANIHNNPSTITGAAIGVDLWGGTATLFQNNITANQTAVIVRNGGSLVSATENFITNNTVKGIRIEATAASIGNINDNDLSGNTGFAIENLKATTVNATCNWYGSTTQAVVAAKISGPVTYQNYLNNGTDNAPGTDGFQPVPGSCLLPVHKYYVNDNSTTGDHYTGAVGNDANPGTSALPFRTITFAISQTVAGDTIMVDAGTYIENPDINKTLHVFGSNMGTAGQAVRTFAESIVQTNGNQNAVIGLSAANSTLDGFTIDGDDPLVAGNALKSGDDANTNYGVRYNAAYNNDTIKNNIIIKTFIGVRGDNAATGNLVSSNWFDRIGNFDFGYAVSLRSNFYADVTNNKMTKCWTGLHTNNHNGGGGPATWSFTGNDVRTYAAGLCYWLNFNGATGLTVDNNQFAAETGAVTNNFGILVVTLQDAVAATFTNNTITGHYYGIGLFNVPTSSTVTLGSTNSISNVSAGVYLTNNLNFNPVGTTNFLAGGPGASSTVNVDGMNIGGNNSVGSVGTYVDGTGGATTQTMNVTNSKIHGFNVGLDNFKGVYNNIFRDSVYNNTNALYVTGSGSSVVSVTENFFNGNTGDAILIDGGSITDVHNNNLAANTGISIRNLTAGSINATCNWYGSASAGVVATKVSGPVVYNPFLNNGTDNAPGTTGFQPVPGSCLAIGNLYVNDNFNTGDHYTTALGNDANTGASNSPFRTIQHAINVASPGDSIWVDAGTYVENVTNDKALTFVGSNFGINPNTGVRVAESIVLPATSDPDPLSPGSSSIFYLDSVKKVTINGFTFDGNNPALTSGTLINGVDVDAIEAIGSYSMLDSSRISNNIVKNFSYSGIDLDNYYNGGTPTTANVVDSNKLDNISSTIGYGIGILIYDNCYTTINNNVMTRVRLGVQTGNFWQADPGTSHTITNNTIESGRIGIWHNLAYAGSSNFNITNNSITTLAGSTNNEGIEISSVQGTTGVTVNNNSITGAQYGYDLWNNPTSSTVTINGGTVTNSKVGVFANNYDGYDSDAASSAYSVTGLTTTNCDTAVWVRDNTLNTNSATVAVDMSAGNSFTGTGIGLLIEGADASASFSGATPAAFSASFSKYVRYISNGTNEPAGNINATNVTFGGLTGAGMSNAQLFAAEDKIDHKIDWNNVGFVLVKANNDYVTTNSFYIGQTTTAKIQRGVNPASNGFTVNVGNGTFADNVNVNKEVTILGQGQPNTTVNPAVSNPSCPGTLCGSNVFLVQANNVTIRDLTIDGDNTSLTGVSVGGADVDARNGIVCDFTLGTIDNLSVTNVTAKNIYYRGIYNSADGAFSITNSTVDNVQGDPASYAMLNFGGTGTFANNTITNSTDGIASNYSRGTIYSGNTVTGMPSGIHTDNMGGGAPALFADTIRNNTITNGTPGAYGILLFMPYRNVVVDNNTVTNVANGLANAGQGAAVTPVFSRNTIDGMGLAGSIGVTQTTDQFGFGTGNVNGLYINNFIRNNAEGFHLDYQAGNTNNITANENSITGNTAGVVKGAGPLAAGTLINNFNCNWWGSALAPTVAANVTATGINYTPFLITGTDNAPGTPGFQPVPGSCFVQTNLYVNDFGPTGDHYTTAVGNDANPGTPAAPFRTIQHAIDVANAGDTIWVDAGFYAENIINTQKNRLVFKGSNYGISAITGIRLAESRLVPATSDPDPLSPTSTAIFYLDSTRRNVIDGFTFDGDNPLLTSAVNINGANIDAIEAIGSWNRIDSVTIKNNIIKNFSYAGIDLDNYYSGGIPTTGSTIQENNIDNLMPSVYGIGILLYDNCYASAIVNNMTRTRIGIQTGNFYRADPGNSRTFQTNTIRAARIGIWHNLQYAGASDFSLSNNTVLMNAGSTNSEGIKITSVQGTVGVNINGNSIGLGRIGFSLWNNPTSNTITPVNNGVSNCAIGVFVNNYDGYSSDAASSTYRISQLGTNYCDTAVYVRDNALNSNGATVSLDINNCGNWSDTNGVFIEGAGASVTFSGSPAVNFASTPVAFNKYIRYISNGIDVPTGNIDATNVQFSGIYGNAMTNAQLFAVEDKIDHKIDWSPVGFVTVKALNDYVTPNSFYLPFTTTAKIQRGVTAASNGWTENVSAGTYAENVTVNKQISVLGAKAGQATGPRFGAFVSLKADPTVETVVTSPVNNPTGPNPNANDLFRVTANFVTIDGFVFDGNNPALGLSLVKDNLLLDIHARRAITNLDTLDGFNPVNGLNVRNNIMQNFSSRGVSLANNGPVSTGNLITQNLVRGFGWDLANGGQGIILFTNAYADIRNNTIDVPANQIGLHLQNFFNNGAMTWSGNNVTVGQNGIGIHSNLFYAPAGLLDITANTVDAAPGVLPTVLDYTWGINVWSTQAGSNVRVTNNTVGSAGGVFDRGINLWNNPTSASITVRGGTVTNSAVGVDMDNVDVDFGAGANTNSVLKSIAITTAAGQDGVRLRAATIGIVPVAGSVSATIDSLNIRGAGNNGILIDGPTAPYSATATISNTSINSLLTGISLTGARSSANIHDNPATISGAVVGLNIDAGIVTNLFRNRFTNNANAVVVTNGGRLSSTQENFINNSSLDAIRIDPTAGTVGPIMFNDLSANTGFAINNLSAPNIAATCNWYGTNIAAAVALKINGSVTYSPILLNGTDAQPGTNGFQPIPGVCSPPLPVTFTSLNAVKADCEVKVKWTVENQLNVDRYEVEVSKDGITFTKVATVAAQNVTVYAASFYLNDQIKAPAIFIRIRNVDKDGNYKYSTTVSSAGTCEMKGQFIVYGYPNPVSAADRITLSTREGLFNGRYKLTLLDNSGKVYSSKYVQLSSVKTCQFEFGQHLASGKYMIIVKKDDGTEEGVVEFQKLD